MQPERWRKIEEVYQAAVELLNEARRQGRSDLSAPEAQRLLECYGIAVARSAVAKDEKELGEVAQGVRYPVSRRRK